MSKNAGQLLWNRVNLFIDPGATVDVDTGLCQVLKAWGASSINEPGFGFPSRIQVIPMAPVGGWLDVSHGEPFLDPERGGHALVGGDLGAPAVVERHRALLGWGWCGF